MADQYPERRHDAVDLRNAVASLNSTVGDLKLAVGELKITVGTMTTRDTEDRGLARDVSKDVDDLKLWRSRIKGQLALIYIALGAVGATVIARALHLLP